MSDLKFQYIQNKMAYLFLSQLDDGKNNTDSDYSKLSSSLKGGGKNKSKNKSKSKSKQSSKKNSKDREIEWRWTDVDTVCFII